MILIPEKNLGKFQRDTFRDFEGKGILANL